jgi:uncharacterized protein
LARWRKPGPRRGSRSLSLELDAAFFALAIPAVMLAGISKGGFGSGAAFVATPLLALVIPPGDAIGLMLPLLMLADVAALGPYWGKWNRRDARLLILGSVPGILVGAVLYRIAPADTFRALLGVIALGFVAYQVIRARRKIPVVARVLAARWALLAGLVSGFTSFISHAGGPPVAVYLLAEGTSKTTYQATTVLVFWAVNLMKVVPYAVLGIFTLTSLKADLMLAPFLLLGVFIGVKAHHVLPERIFFAITYALLTVTGAKLIWDALG